ncbi:TLD-domain-containing protein [Radiomyces spectabilis]|uniref:TLD-domain-containing protein n=1 Tax=Radiomyces spectabilis TaxID=64574 RepID=UPI0022200F73|nr:TLD-domain-containing protein [Radiomyces spectabilis]KAI8366022.1 TLD-domain-containing protein [Radiomyces spectabilis]
MGRGATLIIVKTKDGFVLGGYGDEPWKPVTDWYGNPRNFLFRLGHRDTGSSSVPYNDDGYLSTGAWQGTNHNTHFQYLCWGKKSLPNGLGMGGQFEYPGFWLDADLHLGRSCAGPTCTTYNSPQLSHDQMFEIDEIEVWLVNPVRIDPDDPTAFGQGFSRAENMEFLEMAGKKMYSKDLQKPPNATQDDQDD